jgi:hypothetical protein
VRWRIPYDGREGDFEDTRMTAGEAALQKRLTGGATPTAADALREELDPDAWVAALTIARRRAGLDEHEATDLDLDRFDLDATGPATRRATSLDERAAGDREALAIARAVRALGTPASTGDGPAEPDIGQGPAGEPFRAPGRER